MPPTRRATPLSRERVLRAAIELVGRSGLAALSMRKLGQALGVEAMSLYNHVANKDAILDGITELVVAEIALPLEGEDWRTSMRRRAHSAREVFARYPWAIGLLESRAHPGPATLRYHDAVIGCLRRGGFSVAMAAHAFALLDSYIFGFMVQLTSLPFEGPEATAAVAEVFHREVSHETYPHLVELLTEHVMKPGYDFAAEFEFGLELILDALEHRLAADATAE